MLRRLIPVLALILVSEPTYSHAQLALADSLEAVMATHPEATVAVAVRDDATGTVINIRSERSFHAASTMKVPVMIEAYRRAEEGTLDLDSTLLVKNEFRSIVDSTLFSIEDDSDDAIYAWLGTEKTFHELIHQMMSVSSNLATNLLIDFLVADSIQRTVDRLGAPGMRVLRGVEDLKAFDLGLSNSTTAEALAGLLEHLVRGTAVAPATDRAMIEVMFANAFRDMIPAGLPPAARVANKTGFITRIHHDGAIVFPEEGAPYVLVILIEGIEDGEASAALGARLAGMVHAALRPEG